MTNIEIIKIGKKDCAPCEQVIPQFERLKAAHGENITFRSLDAIDDALEVLEIGGITTTPQLIFKKDGVEVYRHKGVFVKGRVEKILQEELGYEIKK